MGNVVLGRVGSPCRERAVGGGIATPVTRRRRTGQFPCEQRFYQGFSWISGHPGEVGCKIGEPFEALADQFPSGRIRDSP
jgi:hypothetical protein